MPSTRLSPRWWRAPWWWTRRGWQARCPPAGPSFSIAVRRWPPALRLSSSWLLLKCHTTPATSCSRICSTPIPASGEIGSSTAICLKKTKVDCVTVYLQLFANSFRINAILRFQVMWKLRYQVWPRMEEGASLTFKVPPPGIEFTLPSPKIGIESLPIVDPPWSPHVKTKDMEVTLNQERHVSTYPYFYFYFPDSGFTLRPSIFKIFLVPMTWWNFTEAF